MARGERREALGSSRRKLVQVAAAIATAAAGISSMSAPASTSQRKRNQPARQIALDHNSLAVTPLCSEDPRIRIPLICIRLSQPITVATGSGSRIHSAGYLE